MPGSRTTDEPIEFPDGSVWYPGFVIFNLDDSQAANYERHVKTQAPRPQRVYAQNDEVKDEAVAQKVQYLDAGISPYRPSSPESENRSRPEAYGRVVQIAAGIKTTGLWTPLLENEKEWMVIIQPQGILFDGSDLDTILVNFQWMVGGATFSKQYVLNRSVIYRFPVNARRVMIDFTGINTGDPTFGGLKLNVAVAVGCGDENYVQGLSPLWVQFNQTIAATYVLLPEPGGQKPINSGYLMSFVCIAAALPAGGPFYPMFFDSPTVPVNGQAPLLVGTPLANVGDVASGDDEFASSWGFTTGLAFGLSTTADVYTAAGAGGHIRIDYKVGV
jgi:hypothetical protein